MTSYSGLGRTLTEMLARMANHPFAGLAAIALAAILWAASATIASTLLREGLSPLELSEARAILAAIGFLAVGGARTRRVGPRVPWVIAFLGLSLAAINATYYLAIDHLAVAVAIILQYVGPALVVAAVAVGARKAPSPRILGTLALSLLGIVLVSEVPGGDFGRISGVGIAAGLGSAVFFATYTLLSERAGHAYGPLGTLSRAFPVAALFWICFQIPRGWPSGLFEPTVLPKVLIIGVVGTLMPFFLYLWGIHRVRSERASIAATMEPVMAAAFAWLFLGQQLGLMQMAGGVLIIGAVLSLQVRTRPEVAG